MRRLFALLMCLLPLVAVGQSVGGDMAMSQRLLSQQTYPLDAAGSGLMVPLWHGTDGRLLILKADRTAGANALRDHSPLLFHQAAPVNALTTGLEYGLAPRLQAHAEVSQYSWVNQPMRVVGSEVGATYDAGPYSVGVSVGSNAVRGNNTVLLPRVLAGATPGIDGLSGFDSSTQLMAHGRLALGSKSGIDLGASVGLIRLLPGNVLGVSTLDQRALSFGIDHGPLSGTLVGRTMQPQAGVLGVASADRRWNSIDLGVTWRLPWRGQLSVGAQNLWSSGAPANTPVGPEPDQSRTPYVQYHQDL